MKRPLPVLLALLALSCASAQDAYFGLHVDVVGSPDPGSVAPLGGLQLGGPLLDGVELRASGFVLVLVNFLQVDLLYWQRLSDTLRGYAGGGPDVLLLAFTDGPALGVHGTAGVEYRTGSLIGLFAEVQPIFVVSGPYTGFGTFFGKLNLGVNFHF